MKKIISIICLITMLITLSACSRNYSVDSDKLSIIPNSKNNVNKIFYNTVKFDTNGGSYIEPISAKTISSIPNTRKDNHIFDGWFFDEYFTTPISLPLTVTADITLYAKWLKIKDTTTLTGTTIKGKLGYRQGTTYNITPRGFDFNALSQKGCSIRITVEYDVYYEKDYDVLWDIGYLGAPKYEAYLYDLNERGDYNKNLNTAKSKTSRTLEYTSSTGSIKDQEITLEFSTDNIQNKIHFTNIIVTYECY